MRIVLSLIALNFIFFMVQTASPAFTEAFQLTPSSAFSGAPWQFITYMFLHADLQHILTNMLTLGLIGFPFEYSVGERRFLYIYLASGIGSGVIHMLLTGFSNIPLVGASGAIYGILAAYGVKHPKAPLIVGFFAVPAALGVVVFAGVQFLMGFYDLESGVANFGHFGGIITGAVMMLYWRWREGSLKRQHRDQKEERLDEWKFFWESPEWQKGSQSYALPTVHENL